MGPFIPTVQSQTDGNSGTFTVGQADRTLSDSTAQCWGDLRVSYRDYSLDLVQPVNTRYFWSCFFSVTLPPSLAHTAA